MRKKALVLALIILSLLLMNVSLAWADESDNTQAKLAVTILSPKQVQGYAGKEETIHAQVTNRTDQSLQDILVYITMADLSKNSTVNLEDFNADKPVLLPSLGAKESQIVDLPIRFVYTSRYDLYVTAISKGFQETVSSVSIPIQITGNTHVDKNQVLILSVLEPFSVLMILAGIQFKRFRLRNYKSL